jgi:murein DD-endopeptidase MepM/ murein hydrolase activator NlpD
VCFLAAGLLAGCLPLLGGAHNRAPVAVYGSGAGAGSTGQHTVLKGDTVYTISQYYRLPVQDIIRINLLSAPYVLSQGQRLKLPPPREYKVRAGDSVHSIARLFNVQSYELVRLNQLVPSRPLRGGQVLRLPALANAQNPPAFQKPAPKSLPSRDSRIVQVPATKSVISKPVVAAPQSPAVSAIPKPGPLAGAKFLKPVQGHIISAYGPKSGGLFNDGINIAAPRHAPVRAAENGVVVFAGDGLKGFGNLVLVRHDAGWITAYAHLESAKVLRGQTLQRGQVIGTVGATGNVPSPQLHFELRRGSEPLNPEPFLKG